MKSPVAINRPLWVLAFRNLLRNRRRSFATGLAVTLGFVGLILLGGYVFRAFMGLRASTIYLIEKGHVAVLKTGSLENFSAKPKKFILTGEELRMIDEALKPMTDQVELTGLFLTGIGLLNRDKTSLPVILSGIEPDVYQRLMRHPELMKWGKDWVRDLPDQSYSTFKENPQAVSATALLADSIGLTHPLSQWPQEQRSVQLIAQNYHRDLGAVEAELALEHTTGMQMAEGSSVLTPLKLLQDLLDTDGAEYMAVFLKDAAQTRSVAQRLKTTLGENFDVVTYDNERWSPVFVGTMNFLYVMSVFFIFIVLGVVAFILVNTTTLNLLERTREIGTLRAIGFTPSELQMLFRREAFLLTTFCIAVGGVLAVIIADIINSMNLQFHPPAAQGKVQFLLLLNPLICLAVALLVYLITLLSTEFIVRHKSRENIIGLLAETGA